jgi:hypothetical protein
MRGAAGVASWQPHPTASSARAGSRTRHGDRVITVNRRPVWNTAR